MKRIATITFHWATNYGAVLQSFALQKYLEKCGLETEVIDYVPFRVKLLTIYSWIIHKKFGEFKKEILIEKFRKSELTLSKKRYRSSRALITGKFDYECIISGSDQIWNKNFTMNLDGKPNFSYFLDFVGEDVKKLAYAVSFGASSMPGEYYDMVIPYAGMFQAISVREESALPMVERMGKKAFVVCDPTLLLDRCDYEKLIEGKQYHCGRTFSYILHMNQKTAQLVADEVKKIYGDTDERMNSIDMYEWLYRIKNADMVVTNSFHGTMLSLIFNTPFIVMPVEGSDMNDRIATILRVVNLENRVMDRFDREVVRSLCAEKIDWNSVNSALKEYSRTGKEFLASNLLNASV